MQRPVKRKQIDKSQPNYKFLPQQKALCPSGVWAEFAADQQSLCPAMVVLKNVRSGQRANGEQSRAWSYEIEQ